MFVIQPWFFSCWELAQEKLKIKRLLVDIQNFVLETFNPSSGPGFERPDVYLFLEGCGCAIPKNDSSKGGAVLAFDKDA